MKKKKRAFLRLPWHANADLVLKAHRMLMLVGPPGVGKTEYAFHAAHSATGELPELIQGTPELERTDCWGQTELRGDHTEFKDGPVPRALRENRWLIIEELNLIPFEVRASLLGLRGRPEVRHPGTGEVLPVPERFRIIATANPESLACRRNGLLAQAVLDDFLVLSIEPVEVKQVRKMLARDFPDASGELLDLAVDRWKQFREVSSSAEEDGQPDVSKPTVGYRSVKHFVQLCEVGMDPDESTKLAFVNRFISHDELYEAAKLREMLG